jgi:hypothetical protein
MPSLTPDQSENNIQKQLSEMYNINGENDKESEDPMTDLMQALIEMVERFAANSDTDTDPLSMLNKNKKAINRLNTVNTAAVSTPASVAEQEDVEQLARMN